MPPKMTFINFKKSLKSLTKITCIKLSPEINSSWWDQNYKNTMTELRFCCEDCQTFFPATVNNILYQNTNCPSCSIKNMSKIMGWSREEFILTANQVHNFKYSYELITDLWWEQNYIGKKKSTTVLIPILCKEHGKFEQTASSHLQKHGCKTCASSLGELFISNFLRDRNIYFESEYTFDECRSESGRLFRFDFYIKSLNLIIEYHGQQHFEPVNYFGGEREFINIKERDIIKENFIRSKGIKIISVPYWHYSELQQILNSLVFERQPDSG